MYSKVALVLALLGTIHSIPEQYFNQNQNDLANLVSNKTAQVKTQIENDNLNLGEFMRSFSLPYNNNNLLNYDWSQVSNLFAQQQQLPQQQQQYPQAQTQQQQQQNQDPSKHLFLNQPPLRPLPAFLPAPAPLPLPLPLPQPAVVALPVPKPFAIQQPTITSTGEIIIENLLGGIPFNCLGRPTGHFRDTNYCDVFHACVHGQQRKTYSCPFVGEAQYFDDVTRRCEFVRNNPLGCSTRVFFH